MITLDTTAEEWESIRAAALIVFRNAASPASFRWGNMPRTLLNQMQLEKEARFDATAAAVLKCWQLETLNPITK